jgi:WD40 repeat protein
MHAVRNCVACFLVLALAAPLIAEDKPKPDVPVGERDPVLRIEAQGATALVTGLAFEPDGKTLYVAGQDKVIRVWTREGRGKPFKPTSAYRVPLGPGVQGALNALALSADGKWLAVAGSGALRETAGFREPGLVWIPSPAALNASQRLDQGSIYVFNTSDGTVRRLQGHTGAVWALSFVQGSRTPLLASIAWRQSAERRVKAEARLWNLETNQVVEAPPNGLPEAPEPVRPGITAWQRGEDWRQTRVILALKDGVVRTWDVQGEQIHRADDGALNQAVVYLPRSKQFVSASFLKADRGPATFTLWDGQAAQPGYKDYKSHGVAPTYYVPFAMAPTLLPGDRAAVVCYVSSRDEQNRERKEYRLLVLDTARLQVESEVPLWDGLDSEFPVVAVDPTGESVAVAGNSKHAVQVFRVETLPQQARDGRRLPRQELQSVGVTTLQVRWLAKEGKTGLLLRSSREPIDGNAGPRLQDGDRIFDLAQKPSLSADDKGWRIVPARSAPQETVERWAKTHGINAKNVTAAQLLPADKRLNRPLLAVAYAEEAVPGLGLYDAETGEQVRELTGHLAPITSLAFSENGELLASASLDQTVSVWDLRDVPDLIGKRGTLRGVVVSEKGEPGKKQELTVVHVEPNNPAKDELRPGDVVQSLADQGPDGKPRQRTFDFARELYVALAEHKPGEEVRLNLRGNRTVKVRLSQAIDERKPLLSLFVTRDEDWIGWSPMGPYEASGLRAENYLGWHQGTENPQRPTAFALANQFQEKYRKPGVLRELLATGKATPPQPPPPPKPRMTLFMQDTDNALAEQDMQDRFVLRRRTARLRLGVEDFPPSLIESLTWRLDDAPPREFAPGEGREWSADLTSTFSWDRKPHMVRVTLRSKADRQEYPAEVRFLYQPPPPKLTLLAAGTAKPGPRERVVDVESMTEDFALRFQAAPGSKGEKAAVRGTHQAKNNKPDKFLEFETAEITSREATVKLLPGLNTIEIVADDAADATRSARLVVQAVYKPEPVRVLLKEVVPLSADDGTRIEIAGGRPILVHTPKVRVRGMVKAKGEVTAQWTQGKAKPQALPLGAEKAFEQDMTLEPGRHDFTFTANGAGQQKDAAAVTILFAPLPPAVTLVTPKPVYEGEHKGDVIVEGRLPEDRAPYPLSERIVLVNDKPAKDAQVTIQEAANAVHVSLPLKPGEYQVQVKLKNAWDQTASSNIVPVRYLSPPRELRVEPPTDAVKKPLVDLRATLISHQKVTSLQATAWKKGTTAVYPIRTAEPKLLDAAKDRWEVVLEDVPLSEGTNVVRLTASNAHGPAQRDGEIEVEYKPPIEPPIIHVQGSTEDKSRKREYDLRFQVVSHARLERVEVVQGTARLRPADDVTKVKPTEKGLYEYKGTVRVALESGLNPLEIVAVNAGGVAHSPTVTVNFVPLPVRLEIDAIAPRGGKLLALERAANREINVAHAPQPQLVITGRVIWDDAHDPMLQIPKLEIHSYVNGFRQMIGELLPPLPPSKTERPFRVEVLLNREKDNRIDFQIPELPAADKEGPQLRIAQCAKFRSNQRLHLLILGANPREGNEQRERILAALHARKDGDIWRSQVFERIEVHGPITLERERLVGQFNYIKGNLQARGIDGTSDIVMIYFKGSEAIQGEQHVLTGRQDKQKKRVESALSCSGLVDFFKENRGAQLLFLDVMRDAATSGKDQIVEWQDDPRVSRVGVFRYSWLAAKAPAKLPDDAQMDRVLQNASRLRDVRDGLSKEVEQLAKQYREGREQFPYFHLVPALGEAVVNYISGK